MKRDYYDILGVSRRADDKEIKSAYRRLAKRYHPDANPGDKRAEEKFKELSEAYDVLKEPEKRKLYDKFGHSAFEQTDSGARNAEYTGDDKGSWYREYHFSGGDFEDIFGDIFGDGFGSTGFGGGMGASDKNREAFGRGTDIEAHMTISFDEAAKGCTKQVYFQGREKPPLEVKIPAGIDEGQSIRLKGNGNAGKNGAKGDMYIRIHVASKTGYERRGLDVYTTEQIPYTTAVLGGTAVFDTLYGRVRCRIPAGTQSGSNIRLRGKGIVSLNNSEQYGDAYVTVQIAVPKNPSAEEKDKLRELAKLQKAS